MLFAYLSQIITTFLALITSIFISRILGVSGRGSYAIFTNGLGLANVWLGFSIPSTIVFYVASNKFSISKLFSSLTVFTFFTSGLVFLLLIILKQLQFLNFVFPSENQTINWIILFSVQYFFTAFNAIIQSFLNAKEQFFSISILSIVSSLILTITYLLFYFKFIPTPKNIDSFTFVVICSLLLSIMQSMYYLYFFLKVILEKIKIEWLNVDEFKSIIDFSLTAWLCNAISFLTYRMDLWFLKFHYGNLEVGIYAQAVTLAQFVWLLPNAISSVFYSYVAKNDLYLVKIYFYKLSKIVFYAGLLIGIFAFIGFYYFVPIFYGAAFKPSIFLIALLLPGITIFNIAILTASLHAGRGKVLYNLYITIASFIICLLLDVFLIKKSAGVGASIATSISYISATILHLLYANYAYKIDIYEIFKLEKKHFTLKYYKQ
jgi:O-antigen/teichoic acid export membrane protein